MILYPPDLPCASRIEGHSASVSAGLVRTPMEAGNTRQRRAQRVMPHQITLTFVMPQGTLADWMTWVNAYAFDQWIAMKLPGVLAGRALVNTTPTPVRFCSDIALELLPVARLWYWRARVLVEWLPTGADLLPMTWFVANEPDLAQLGADWIVAGAPASPSLDNVLAGTAVAPSVPLI
jgi:hypothetical protein